MQSLLHYGRGKQRCGYFGAVGVGDKQKVQAVSVQSSVDALYLVWPVKLELATQQREFRRDEKEPFVATRMRKTVAWETVV